MNDNERTIVIYEGFVDFNDMCDNFSLSKEDLNFLNDALIIYAVYDQGNYDGSSFVVFRKNDKYYEVNGSHCSCYRIGGSVGA